MARRRSTVHDFSSLRLHPDGTRVRTTTARQSKYVAKDSLGNLIAVDAGGSATVKNRRRIPDHSAEDHEEININVSSENEQPEEHVTDPGTTLNHDRKGKEKAKPLKDDRAKKRQNFYKDLKFIERITNRTRPSRSLSSEPSSDLLKRIHHFAAEFYTENGQLLDMGREARREKKQRKLERQRHQTEYDHGVEESNSNDELDDSDGELGDTSESDASKVSLGRTGRRNGKEQRKKKQLRDMYKVFDGTALMALGMLFQERVLELLRSEVAPEWEEAMLATGDGTMQDFDGGKVIIRKEKQSEKDTERLEDSGVQSESDDSDWHEYSDAVR